MFAWSEFCLANRLVDDSTEQIIAYIFIGAETCEPEAFISYTITVNELFQCKISIINMNDER